MNEKKTRRLFQRRNFALCCYDVIDDSVYNTTVGPFGFVGAK